MKNKKVVRNIFNNLKRFWNFIWNGEGIWSWITFLIVIFIVIKFIFFPTISLLMGSSLPIVIVESCSMYHGENFNDWWRGGQEWYENQEITKEQFEKFPLKNGFAKGDIIFVRGVKKENLEIGDTIIFDSKSGESYPIIHRIVDLEPLGTKGDNRKTNSAQIPFEKNIQENQIIGKATFIRVPLIGWFKLIFFEPFREKNERGFCK